MEIKKPDLNWRSSLNPITRKIEKLIQHHMAHTTWNVFDVHNYHRNSNGWNGIGYNYWIGFDGVIYEARGRNVGAHAGSNWNGRSLGIGYQGNFETQAMTDAQLKSGVWLNSKLIREEDLSVDDVVGHGGVSATLCPGKNFRMEELKNGIKKLLTEKKEFEVVLDLEFIESDNIKLLFNSNEENSEYRVDIREKGEVGYKTIREYSKDKELTLKLEYDKEYEVVLHAISVDGEYAGDYLIIKAEEEEGGNGNGSGGNDMSGTPIKGQPLATVEQAQLWAKNRGAHQRFIDIAPVYWKLASEYGIRPEVMYCQSFKETAGGRFSGKVAPDYNNWAGIKIARPIGDRPVDHQRFNTPEDGVRAHYNHMGIYCGVEPIGKLHERYPVTTDVAKRRGWFNKVLTVEDLSGKWAPSPDYGFSIVRDYLVSLMNTPKPNPNPNPIPPVIPPNTECNECKRLNNIIKSKDDEIRIANLNLGESERKLNNIKQSMRNIYLEVIKYN